MGRRAAVPRPRRPAPPGPRPRGPLKLEESQAAAAIGQIALARAWAETLQRHGFTDEQLAHLKDAYRLLFRSKLTLKEAVERVRAEVPADEHVEHLLRFVESSQRGLTR